MKTRPAAQYALLGTLMSGPKHGYEMMQFLDAALSSTWRVGPSQLYSVLRRLEKQGLLESAVQAQETRPSKRVFSITPEGEKVFLDWLKQPAAHVRDLRVEFLARIFFFEHLSLEGAEALIEGQIKRLERLRDRLVKTKKEENRSYERLVLGFRLATVEAWLGWLIHETGPFLDRLRTGADDRKTETWIQG